MGQLRIKGRGNEIELSFTDCDIQEALLHMKNLTEEKKAFFCLSNSRISYSGLTLSYDEEILLNKAVLSTFGEEVTFVKKKTLTDEEIYYSLCDNMTICTVINKSLRSGEEVTARGDVIIYGDVNPGATVTAKGNITVIGALRGSAYTTGNGKVYATYMHPTQIRIGNIYSYNKKKENVGAAVALSQNGEIILNCL